MSGKRLKYQTDETYSVFKVLEIYPIYVKGKTKTQIRYEAACCGRRGDTIQHNFTKMLKSMGDSTTCSACRPRKYPNRNRKKHDFEEGKVYGYVLKILNISTFTNSSKRQSKLIEYETVCCGTVSDATSVGFVQRVNSCIKAFNRTGEKICKDCRRRERGLAQKKAQMEAYLQTRAPVPVIDLRAPLLTRLRCWVPTEEIQ